MEDQPTHLWTLRRQGREVACLVKLVPDGIEIHIAYDGAAVMTRVFDTGDEALAWAAKTRAERERARGWHGRSGVRSIERRASLATYDVASASIAPTQSWLDRCSSPAPPATSDAISFPSCSRGATGSARWRVAAPRPTVPARLRDRRRRSVRPADVRRRHPPVRHLRSPGRRRAPEPARRRRQFRDHRPRRGSARRHPGPRPRGDAIAHVVYVSVAQPAPVMQAYVRGARRKEERGLVRETGLAADLPAPVLRARARPSLALPAAASLLEAGGALPGIARDGTAHRAGDARADARRTRGRRSRIRQAHEWHRGRAGNPARSTHLNSWSSVRQVRFSRTGDHGPPAGGLST